MVPRDAAAGAAEGERLMDHALQQRHAPPGRPEQGAVRRDGLLAGAAWRSEAAQLQLAERLNAGPAAARVTGFGAVLDRATAGAGGFRTGGQRPLAASKSDVVQRVSDDEKEEEDPELQAGDVAQQQDPAQEPAAQPGAAMEQDAQQAPQAVHGAGNGFTMDQIVFSSRRTALPGARPVGIAERSVYFHDGRRLRLDHVNGPTISHEPMRRYTFKEKPESTAENPRYYGKSDYHDLRRNRNAERDGEGRLVLDSILKEAAVGDPGKLFEIDPQRERRTHRSRGSPALETDIRDQNHLDALIQIATEADQARGGAGWDPETFNQQVRATFLPQQLPALAHQQPQVQQDAGAGQPQVEVQQGAGAGQPQVEEEPQEPDAQIEEEHPRKKRRTE